MGGFRNDGCHRATSSRFVFPLWLLSVLADAATAVRPELEEGACPPGR
ncbi:Hypothetical protein MIP_05330 [Mycobacterium intracellulare subsp. intracellulare MTCC 9506]|uniref:Uncharacterized protein n=1 Tax=Mycobacterium indicus pranii (strain DSM 45239 / MTCC 9506) TaxID=1232724 RepID=J9WEC1_MYCIP|nr:Hypothetical protein MIP_05330 [Mycobacterium intracellulare subsp. intracellulare MTCC 9506]